MKSHITLNRIRYLESPVGWIGLGAFDAGLSAVWFSQAPGEPVGDAVHLDKAVDQLRQYFDGDRRSFELELTPRGTPFQRAVWDALRAIPFGATSSYAEIARRIGSPDAVRAVGAANGANPLAIIIPCHRVIASDGSLHGYAGGLHRKRWLLDHEMAAVGSTLFAGSGRA